MTIKKPKIFVIAEAGVNHNGSFDEACRLVDVAANAGADAVKFQSFSASSLVTREAPSASYQQLNVGNHESQYELLKRLELSGELQEQLNDYCSKQKIAFLSTPFDKESLDLLVGLGVDQIKIPSGEVVNGPHLLHVARTGLPVIMSTGMATLEEIEIALGVLAFGYMNREEEPPTYDNFKKSFSSTEGQTILRRHVSLLHCSTQYPTPFSDVNLFAMDTLAETFGLTVGYSDHTEGFAVAIAAVARGATVIEKHITLDRSLPGPDQKVSLEPDELVSMVTAIRAVEEALGQADKRPTIGEQSNMAVVRRSLVAACPIRKGEKFSIRNVAVKRPANGLSPMRYWEILGLEAKRDYEPDEGLDI